ncbi:hypothetical protein MYX76_16950 [Desulfobacterota bacterium AH_259_B03_O07]|nr:hypothetical protein [Desulfobacterota bacterium AH_259_B03_O07]
MALDSSAGFGLSVQPLYPDDKSPPEAIVVGMYYPIGTLPTFDDKFQQDIESKSKEDLGSKYSVSANYVKRPTFEGVELIISKIGQ